MKLKDAIASIDQHGEEDMMDFNIFKNELHLSSDPDWLNYRDQSCLKKFRIKESLLDFPGWLVYCQFLRGDFVLLSKAHIHTEAEEILGWRDSAAMYEVKDYIEELLIDENPPRLIAETLDMEAEISLDWHPHLEKSK